MSDETNEGEGPATPSRQLKHADWNPWYVLMTLYGADSHYNRKVWNAWAGQALTEEEKKKLSVTPGDPLNEVGEWSEYKSEVETFFANETKRRAGKELRIPDPLQRVDLSGLLFDQILDLMGLVFPRAVSFSGSDLRFGLWANNAYFCKHASWSRASVEIQCIFDGAIFESQAVFETTNFVCDVEFDQVKFCSSAIFSNSKFGAKSSFSLANFEREAVFSGCVFSGVASFRAVNFLGAADFPTVTFESRADFGEAQFLSDAISKRFGRRTSVSTPVRFVSTDFKGSTDFSNARFSFCYPDFSGAVLHEKTSFTKDSFEKSFWPGQGVEDVENAQKTCGAIRHVLSKQGLPEEAHFFFRREMYFAEAVTKSQSGSFWQRLPYLLYRGLSDYGHSIARPALWLAGLWAFGFVAFWGFFAGCCVPAPLAEVTRPMGAAMGLSFSNLFPVFGFGRVFFGAEFMASLPPVLKLLAGFQTVASLPLLFFLGLGLRQRFRLR
jgi:uncharacterized protein YjbI with pentapeptide repeats